jgi:hypothetical protein
MAVRPLLWFVTLVASPRILEAQSSNQTFKGPAPYFNGQKLIREPTAFALQMSARMPLSSRGTDIVDKDGFPVHLHCVNWYGLRIKKLVLICSKMRGNRAHTWAWHAQYFQSNFGCVRVLGHVQASPVLIGQTEYDCGRSLGNKNDIYCPHPSSTGWLIHLNRQDQRSCASRRSRLWPVCG